MMQPLAILSGGLATRLYPVTKTMPKAMLDVAGKPFIARQMELLKQKGFSRIVICAGFLGEQIQQCIGNGASFGLSVTYSFEGETLLGTGGAIKKALPFLDDVFCVMYGDSYLNTDFAPIADYFSSQNKKALMAVFKNHNQWDTSNIVYENGMVVTYDKKNKTSAMHYIDYGFSIVRKKIFSSFPDDTPFDLADVFQAVVCQGEMLGYEVKKRFYEIGSLQGLEETRAYFEKLK